MSYYIPRMFEEELTCVYVECKLSANNIDLKRTFVSRNILYIPRMPYTCIYNNVML